ncbi:hypothetical protein pneo_cds_721 [Pandoravirus neocaledonia]|uniref:Uncharacterized protein n=1 Tax=Pandoravirus neocaledonia TaxID=2107708 RepID=A0A2U7UCY6_9VIRU|nr:hypothetical protein pneo_cds_721 [Pandoravirus neocaledonia]AVK76328.1 hypothetical protein pneo_cds_721 [Pandoravirus neocaledonia]
MNHNQSTAAATAETATQDHSRGASAEPAVDTACAACKTFAAQWRLNANDICQVNAPTGGAAVASSGAATAVRSC